MTLIELATRAEKSLFDVGIFDEYKNYEKSELMIIMLEKVSELNNAIKHGINISDSYSLGVRTWKELSNKTYIKRYKMFISETISDKLADMIIYFSLMVKMLDVDIDKNIPIDSLKLSYEGLYSTKNVTETICHLYNLLSQYSYEWTIENQYNEYIISIINLLAKKLEINLEFCIRRKLEFFETAKEEGELLC